jgi:hypothetical protein
MDERERRFLVFLELLRARGVPVRERPVLPDIPDETQEPVATPVSDLPSLDPPEDDNMHIVRDRERPELGALCGRKKGSTKMHHEHCEGTPVAAGSRVFCPKCHREICKTCVDILYTYFRSGIKEW